MDRYDIDLEYFTIHARAEFIRIYLHDHGVKFKDTRHTLDEWKAIKNDPVKFIPERYPFGLMPVMHLTPKQNGEAVTISGSLVILSYLEKVLAKSSGTYTSGMLIDAANSTLECYWEAFWNPPWNKGENIISLRQVSERYLSNAERVLKGSLAVLWDQEHLTPAGAITLQLLDTMKIIIPDGTLPPTLNQFWQVAKTSKAWQYMTSDAHVKEAICLAPSSTQEAIAVARNS